MTAYHSSGVAVPAAVEAGRDWMLSGASLYLYAGNSAGLGVAMARKIGSRSVAVGDSFWERVLSGALLPLARSHFGAERFLLLGSHEEPGHDASVIPQLDGDYSTASIVASVGHLAPMYDPLLGSMILKEWRYLQSRLRMSPPTRVLVSGLVEP